MGGSLEILKKVLTITYGKNLVKLQSIFMLLISST